MIKKERLSLQSIWTKFREMYPNVTVSQKTLHRWLHDNELYYSFDAGFVAQLFASFLRG